MWPPPFHESGRRHQRHRRRWRCASTFQSSQLPLFVLALAAFSCSLLVTVAITRTLTTLRIEASTRALERATRWRGDGGGIGKRSADNDGDLGSLLGERRAAAHLSLFDDDDDDAFASDDEGDDQPPAGACAPMEHTE